MATRSIAAAAHVVAARAEPFDHLEDARLGGLLERIGDARLVLIGEASHGTSEFYRMRSRITEELVARRGFRIVALEADWPDAARLDRYVREAPMLPGPAPTEPAFERFPTWMWRNEEVLASIERLRAWNQVADGPQVSIHGLDLYSLGTSVAEVLRYLEQVDPALADAARDHYGCLTPYAQDPQLYGYAALTDRHRGCEDDVVRVLTDLRSRAAELMALDDRSFLDAEQNARVAAGAERYYRTMYHGGAASWNLRDTHMVETLEALLAFHGPDSRAVVWAHNSHLGDAGATEMAARGEINVGRLVRERFGDGAYLIGQGTDHGTVAAADGWDRPVGIHRVRPAHPDSYERICHESGVDRFLLPVSARVARDDVTEALTGPHLERAIGVIYRPQTERSSHYFEADLPEQFDEWIWFDESRAVTPLDGGIGAPALAPDHPFATIDV